MEKFLFLLCTIFCGWLLGIATVVDNEKYLTERAEGILNNSSYKIDTLKTINNNDTIISYKIVKNNLNSYGEYF